MKREYCNILPLTMLAILVLASGCRDDADTSAPDPDIPNMYQNDGEVHNAICESVLNRMEAAAASIITRSDFDAAFASACNDAFIERGLKADFANTVSAGARILASNYGVKIDENGPGKTKVEFDWADAQLREAYTPSELETFFRVCGHMSKGLSPDAFSAEVSKAERDLNHHATKSSDAMKRALAIARASYRFWHEQGATHLRRLKEALGHSRTVAKVDSADEVFIDNAVFTDAKTMAMSAIGGATAALALELTAVASASQFIYDNRSSLWELVSSEVFWQLWLQGYYLPW